MALLHWFLLALAFITLGFTEVSPSYYVWHWQMRHQINEETLTDLAAVPVGGMFYRAGHFELRDGNPYLDRIRKDNRFLDGFSRLKFARLQLVYTFENSSSNGFVRGYLNAPQTKAIAFIVETIRDDYFFFKAINPDVNGVQIDLEGPGVNFRVFEKLLITLKAALPSNAEISITPMSSWVNKEEFRPVAQNSDFVVPMLYDYHRGKKVNDPLKVTDVDWLKKSVDTWNKLQVPLVIGLPTYSYCVLYDHQGKQAVPWAVTNPESIMNNPVWELISDNLQAEERVLLYRARTAFSFQRQPFQKGSSMKYNLLSSRSVHSYIQAVQSTGAENVQGIAFFRLGVNDEPLVLDARRIRYSVHSHDNAKLHLRVQRFVTETGDYHLVFSNYGDPSWFGGEGLQVILAPDQLLSKLSDFDRIDEKKDTTVLVEEYLDSAESLMTPRMRAGSKTVEVRIHLSDGKVRVYYFKPADVPVAGLELEDA